MLESDDSLREFTVCLLFSSDLDMVYLQQKDRTAFAGKFNGCGGKLKAGETPEDCARREIEEESGITRVQHLSWLGTLSLPENCVTETISMCPEKPGVTLYFFAGILPAGVEPKTQYGQERFFEFSVSSLLATDAYDEYLAGDGDFKYFLRRGHELLETIREKEN